MLGFIKRLFVGSTAKPEMETVIRRIEPGNTLESLPDEKMLCIFRQGQLINHCRESVPETREEGEAWYLLPCSDLTLLAELDIQNLPLTITTQVRLEPESELWVLLCQRDSLTHEDITALVTSQMSGLIEEMQAASAEDIEQLNEADRETFRAKLSLLLQSRGIRCTGILEISQQPVATHQDTETANEPQPQEGKIHEGHLSAAITEVKNEKEWSSVMAALDADGCELDPQSAAKAEALGEQLISQRITAAEAVSQLRRLADEARANMIPRAERLAMRGLDIRLSDVELPVPGDEADESNGPIAGRIDRASKAAWRLNIRRRPWTWWMLDRQKIDDRLRNYLNSSLSHVRSALESERTIGSFQPYFADLRKVDQRLGICLDQLATMPTLLPNMRVLKLNRAEIKAAVKSVESAVRSAETVTSQTKRLQTLPAGEPEWKSTCYSICAALDRLSQDLRSRRQLHQ
ncbi:MAG: hypothetical protein P8L85_00405 [Rubripirellula sp.]|nr:hypothetical protein [Rubripirellula sp.]